MHTHQAKYSPEIGKTYTCIYNDTPLYDAVIEKAEGCWATVKVVQPQSGKYEHLYKPGQQLDIKVAHYEFVEKI
jgi:hypothetical protein